MMRLCRACGEMLQPEELCPCGFDPKLRDRVYNSKRWRSYTRPIVLARDHGLCVNCGERGEVVDHLLPIETLLALGRSPFDPTECQLLCLRCSGHKDGPRWRRPVSMAR